MYNFFFLNYLIKTQSLVESYKNKIEKKQNGKIKI